jgi:MFS family permease
MTDSRLLTRPMVMLLIASVGALGSFYLLLPVVPLYTATGGAGGVGAGLSTGSMMASTVLTELAVPSLLARFGYRSMMGLGLLLLGPASLALIASAAVPLVVAVSLVRGAGLGIAVVTGTALVAELVPAERRGEGLGIYGVSVGLPSVVCLPLGVWLGLHVGYRPVFVTAAALALLVCVAVPGLPADRARIDHQGGVLGGLRVEGLARPAVIFAAVTLAAGIVVTFMPLAVSARSHQLAAVALLAEAALAPLARWGAGRFGDRYGASRLLVPAVLAAAVGTAGLVFLDSPVVVIVGMGLFGAAFGTAQNVTVSLMFARVPRSEFGRVSALWNLAYDAGMGAGAAGFGFAVGPVGYRAGFAATAAVLLAAFGLALRDGR